MSEQIEPCEVCHCNLGEGDCPQCHQVVVDFIDLDEEEINEYAPCIMEDEEMEAFALTEFLLSN